VFGVYVRASCLFLAIPLCAHLPALLPLHAHVLRARMYVAGPGCASWRPVNELAQSGSACCGRCGQTRWGVQPACACACAWPTCKQGTHCAAGALCAMTPACCAGRGPQSVEVCQPAGLARSVCVCPVRFPSAVGKCMQQRRHWWWFRWLQGAVSVLVFLGHPGGCALCNLFTDWTWRSVRHVLQMVQEQLRPIGVTGRRILPALHISYRM
jgi:hypothetical protein